MLLCRAERLLSRPCTRQEVHAWKEWSVQVPGENSARSPRKKIRLPDVPVFVSDYITLADERARTPLCSDCPHSSAPLASVPLQLSRVALPFVAQQVLRINLCLALYS